MITSFNPDKLLSQLQTVLGSSSSDLNQLCKEFFESALSTTSPDLQGLELAYLQQQTGSTSSSIADLWQAYLIQLGYTVSPWDGMMNTAILEAAFSLLDNALLVLNGDTFVTIDNEYFILV